MSTPDPLAELRAEVEALRRKARKKADAHRDPYFGAQIGAYQAVLDLIAKHRQAAPNLGATVREGQ